MYACVEFLEPAIIGFEPLPAMFTNSRYAASQIAGLHCQTLLMKRDVA